MWLLVASIGALFVGPLLVRLAGDRPGVLAALDGFVVTALVGLLALDVFPDSLAHGGSGALVAAAVGIALPRLLEVGLSSGTERLHGLMTWAAVGGYAVHALLDGAALVGGGHEGHAHDHVSTLAVGVVLHRVPVGLTIWWLVVPRYRLRGGAIVVGVIAAATVAGFAGAQSFVPALPIEHLSLFQALVAGSLLHVIVAHPPREIRAKAARPAWAAAGTLVGIASLAGVGVHPFVSELDGIGLGAMVNGIALALAPLALASLAFGQLLWRAQLDRARGAAGRWLAGVVAGWREGCGCGAAERIELHPAGLAKVSAGTFMGLAGLLVSIPLFGSEWALVRAGAALALAGGLAVVLGRGGARERLDEHEHDEHEHAHDEHEHDEHEHDEHEHDEHDDEPESCDGGEPQQAAPEAHRGCDGTAAARNDDGGGVEGIFDRRWRLLLGQGEHLVVWILTGAAVAAVLALAWNERALAGPPAVQVTVAAVFGAVVHAGAAGATPIAAALVAAGLGSGAALAFCLTAPFPLRAFWSAVSARRGGVTASLVAGGFIAAAAGAGLLADAVVRPVGVDLRLLAREPLEPVAGVAALVLAALTVAGLFLHGPRGLVEHLLQHHDHDHHHH